MKRVSYNTLNSYLPDVVGIFTLKQGNKYIGHFMDLNLKAARDRLHEYGLDRTCSVSSTDRILKILSLKQKDDIVYPSLARLLSEREIH